MVFGYQSSRDFFEAVRCAAAEARRAEQQIERLSSAEGPRGGGMSAVGGSRRDPNGMGATDARIDYERRMQCRIEADRRLVSMACDLAYGRDGGGGVSALLGTEYADALWWRYCSAASWARAGEALCVSPSTARRRCEVAMDTIDAKGEAAVMAGMGDAAA